MVPVVAPRPEVVLQTAEDAHDIPQSLRRCLENRAQPCHDDRVTKVPRGGSEVNSRPYSGAPPAAEAPMGGPDGIHPGVTPTT